MQGLVVLVAVSVAMALSPVAALAQSGWLRNGKPVMGEPNLGSSGPLSVMQLATADANGLIAAWPKPSPGAQMKGTADIRTGQITTFLIFKGCTPDPAGLCNVPLISRWSVRVARWRSNGWSRSGWARRQPRATGCCFRRPGSA